MKMNILRMMVSRSGLISFPEQVQIPSSSFRAFGLIQPSFLVPLCVSSLLYSVGFEYWQCSFEYDLFVKAIIQTVVNNHCHTVTEIYLKGGVCGFKYTPSSYKTKQCWILYESHTKCILLMLLWCLCSVVRCWLLLYLWVKDVKMSPSK